MNRDVHLEAAGTGRPSDSRIAYLALNIAVTTSRCPTGRGDV
jgi:hypothetical protein